LPARTPFPYTTLFRSEQADDQIAALKKGAAHRVGRILWPGDRLEGGPLADLRGARFGVGDPAGEHRRERPVGDVADAPAGHRPRSEEHTSELQSLRHL